MNQEINEGTRGLSEVGTKNDDRDDDDVLRSFSFILCFFATLDSVLNVPF